MKLEDYIYNIKNPQKRMGAEKKFTALKLDCYSDISEDKKELIKSVFPYLTEELFMDAFQITPMFRFISRGSNMVIVLDIIKLDKHPVYYLVELLNKIYSNLNVSID